MTFQRKRRFLKTFDVKFQVHSVPNLDVKWFEKNTFSYGTSHKNFDVNDYFSFVVPNCVIDLVDHDNGQTPLHIAASYKKRTVCRMLVQKGASVVRLDTEVSFTLL